MMKRNSYRCVDLILLAVILSFVTACGGGSSGAGIAQPPAGSEPPFVGGFTVFVTARSEIEPNDSLAMAEAQTLPAHGANADYVGFGVLGSVNDTLDPSDYFLFAASRPHDFTIRLCPSMCTPVDAINNIATPVAYFEVLDQDGTLLLSSQGDNMTGNRQEISIDAGIVYYLAVFAEDTLGASQSYYIEMVEKHPAA
jgi:hypothetical protein